MEGWKRVGAKTFDKSKFIKYAPGSAYEGIFMGMNERISPFDKEGKELIYDYTLEMNGEDKILSSTSVYLRQQLEGIEVGQPIRIEMIVKGIKKLYNVYTRGEIPDAGNKV